MSPLADGLVALIASYSERIQPVAPEVVIADLRDLLALETGSAS